jgi:hypothetical protein
LKQVITTNNATSKDKLEQAWKVQDYATAYIQVADAKAGALVGVSTLSATLLTILPPNLTDLERYALGITGIAVLIGTIWSLCVLLPRMNGSKDRGVIFWKHIAQYDNYSTYQQA